LHNSREEEQRRIKNAMTIGLALVVCRLVARATASCSCCFLPEIFLQFFEAKPDWKDSDDASSGGGRTVSLIQFAPAL
jgi:hypothetical protein